MYVMSVAAVHRTPNHEGRGVTHLMVVRPTKTMLRERLRKLGAVYHGSALQWSMWEREGRFESSHPDCSEVLDPSLVAHTAFSVVSVRFGE